MKRHDFPDLGKLMDEIFSAAEDFTNVFTDHIPTPGEKGWKFNREYYTAYSFPPSNIFIKEDKTLVFEFAIAGFSEKDVTLQFKGDYMVFAGKVSEDENDPENVRYFKRRLKRKSFSDQRYYVPADKFDRDAVKAVYKNGILTVTIPPKDEVASEPEVTIDIKNEDTTSSNKEKK